MNAATHSTCDLHDRHEGEARVPAIAWRHYGGRRAFSGTVATVKCFEDNTRVKALCAGEGHGRVLVVDGAASLRVALLGDLIAESACRNGWAGVIVHGCIRDSEAIGAMDIGVLALGTTPRRSVRREQGLVDVPLEFGGITWRPGDRLWADADGVVLLDAEPPASG